MMQNEIMYVHFLRLTNKVPLLYQKSILGQLFYREIRGGHRNDFIVVVLVGTLGLYDWLVKKF